MRIADALISTGLHQVGYEYVNIDAGYLTNTRAADGTLVPNPQKFPNGIKTIASYLHKLDLKLGVYTDLGKGSCGTGPGSGDHYKQDALTFAEWGVDYLKVDYCGTIDLNKQSQRAYWEEFRDALNATGRPIYYSICPKTIAPKNGTAIPYAGSLVYSPPLDWTLEEHRTLSNSWLVEYVNIVDNWYSPTNSRCINAGAICGLITNVDAVVQMTNPSFSGPGGWNDADMLQVCNYGHVNGGMSLTEYQSEYSLWAIFASPLIISADLRSLAHDHPDCLELIKNTEVIAVNQDALGKAGKLVYQYGGNTTETITQQAWVRPLYDGSIAGLMFNRGPSEEKMTLTWTQLGLPQGKSAVVRDLWQHKDIGTFDQSFSAQVASHGVVMIKVKPL